MNSVTAVCINCKAKNNTSALDQINRIGLLLKHIEVPERRGRFRPKFTWGINPRCPYGMQCASIRRNKIRAEKAAHRLEDKMIAAALGDDERLYREVLNHLRGHFPAVYRSLEEIHHKGSAE